MCRQLPSDAADFVTEAVPLLTNLLQYQDSKVRMYGVRLGNDDANRNIRVNCEVTGGRGVAGNVSVRVW